MISAIVMQGCIANLTDDPRVQVEFTTHETTSRTSKTKILEVVEITRNGSRCHVSAADVCAAISRQTCAFAFARVSGPFHASAGWQPHRNTCHLSVSLKLAFVAPSLHVFRRRLISAYYRRYMLSSRLPMCFRSGGRMGL